MTIPSLTLPIIPSIYCGGGLTTFKSKSVRFTTNRVLVATASLVSVPFTITIRLSAPASVPSIAPVKVKVILPVSLSCAIPVKICGLAPAATLPSVSSTLISIPTA